MEKSKFINVNSKTIIKKTNIVNKSMLTKKNILLNGKKEYN